MKKQKTKKSDVDYNQNEKNDNNNLKVVSATFLLVLFVCLKESTCETRKNVFSFTSKALFVLEIINFSDIQM